MIKNIIIIELLTVVAIDHGILTGNWWKLLIGTVAMYIGFQIIKMSPSDDKATGARKMIGFNHTRIKRKSQWKTRSF